MIGQAHLKDWIKELIQPMQRELEDQKRQD
jgi:hypothetical protein